MVVPGETALMHEGFWSCTISTALGTDFARVGSWALGGAKGTSVDLQSCRFGGLRLMKRRKAGVSFSAPLVHRGEELTAFVCST
jgi:hypothetical protein